MSCYTGSSQGLAELTNTWRQILAFRDNTKSLLTLKCGRNIAEGYSDRFTHGFVMTFASRDDLDTYNRSESHRRLVEEFRADLEDKLIFDFYSP